jgi:hypothetical protein
MASLLSMGAAFADKVTANIKANPTHFFIVSASVKIKPAD